MEFLYPKGWCGMAFMEKQVEFGEWYEIETNNGTEFIPADVVGHVEIEDGQPMDDSLTPFIEGTEIESVKLVKGWGARLSAPGYMDCTSWAVYDTEAEAIEALDEEYPDEDEDD
jgi:hypothetical protein